MTELTARDYYSEWNKIIANYLLRGSDALYKFAEDYAKAKAGNTTVTAREDQPQSSNPFSKGYKHRHGEPVSDACGDHKHAECTQDLTKCHCTWRGDHRTPHAYETFPKRAPEDQPRPTPPIVCESNSVTYPSGEKVDIYDPPIEKCPTCHGYHRGGCHRKARAEAQGEAPQVKTLIAKRDALSEKHFQLGGQHADLGSRNCPCDAAKEWRAADLECDAAITMRNSVRRRKSEPKCDHDHCDCGVETGAHPSQDAREELLIPYAGLPTRWCKEFMRVFGTSRQDVYLPAMVALYEQQCTEKFGAGARSTPSLGPKWLDTELWNFAHATAIELGLDNGIGPTSEAEKSIHHAMRGACIAYSGRPAPSPDPPPESELKYAAQKALAWMEGAIGMAVIGPWVDSVTIDMLKVALSHSKVEPVIPTPPEGYKFTQPFLAAPDPKGEATTS